MRVTGQQIIERVAADHQLSVVAITSAAKANRVALPRQTAMYLARTLCPHLSYFAIGQMLGGRDHSTVIHGVRATIKRMASDPILANYVERVSSEVRNRVDMTLRIRILEQQRHLEALYELARAA